MAGSIWIPERKFVDNWLRLGPANVLRELGVPRWFNIEHYLPIENYVLKYTYIIVLCHRDSNPAISDDPGPTPKFGSNSPKRTTTSPKRFRFYSIRQFLLKSVDYGLG
jgi:hypothetical protein